MSNVVNFPTSPQTDIASEKHSEEGLCTTVQSAAAAQSLFHKLFVEGDRLQHLFSVITNACGPHKTDPITYVANIFLTNPVQCAISAAGLLPFRAHPELLFPFASMDDTQKTFLKALQSNANRKHAQIRSQMGGGVLILHFQKHTPLTLAATDVLTAVCRAILSNKEYADDQRLQAANIVMQRVTALTNVSNTTLIDVNRNVQLMFNAHGHKDTHI